MPLDESFHESADSTQQVIYDFAEAIIGIYQAEGLTSVSGLHKEYMLAGRPLLTWHNEVTRRCAIEHNGHFYYMKNIDDIAFCSDSLLYFTAHLFLYRPYINSLTRDAFPAYGRTLYPNLQNLEGKRYSMYLDVVSQAAYNYWDRIGDLIASFFPGVLKPQSIFFPSAISIIPSQFHSSPNYQWLRNFAENEYKEMNGLRKDIVHYHTSDTNFKYEHLERASTNAETEAHEMQQKREGMADFYKQHISVTIEGLEKTLLLLGEIDAALYSHIQ